MDPACQFCGAEAPTWRLQDRATGLPGPEVCAACAARLREDADVVAEARRLRDDFGRARDALATLRQVLVDGGHFPGDDR